MMNIAQLPGMLARMSDAELQQVAMTHKNDAAVLSLAVSESTRRKQMRSAPQGQQMPQATVADQALSGMGPGMAGGGMVSFASGGMSDLIPTDGYSAAPPSEDSGYNSELSRNVDNTISALPGAGAMRAAAGVRMSLPALMALFGGKAPADTVPETPSRNNDAFMRSEKKYSGLMAAADAALPKQEAPPDKRTAPPGTSGARMSARTGLSAAAAMAPAGDSSYVPPTFEQMIAERDKATKAGNKEIDDTYAPYKKQFSDERAALAGRKDDNIKTALIQAGLGMLASKSPYALTAIGEGAGKGFDAYQTAKKLDAEAMKENTRAELVLVQAQRAERSGNLTQATQLYSQYKAMQIANEEMKQKAAMLLETTRHNKASEGLMGMKISAMGGNGSKQTLKELQAEQANIMAQYKINPAMQYTDPTSHKELQEQLKSVKARIAGMSSDAAPAAATTGGAPDFAALAKAEMARRAQGK